MSAFRTSFGLLLVPLLLAVARAEQSHPMIEAARLAAQHRLGQDVADEMAAPGVTVRQVVTRMQGHRLFEAAVAQARQVGGARWLDDSTCQVRVDLPAERILDLLETLQQSNPNLSPVSFDDLVFKRKVWRQKVFSATGTSVTWERALAMNPPAEWRGVAIAERRAALEDARREAARRLVGLVATCIGRDVPALAADVQDDSGKRQLERWAAAQPIVAVRFREDRSVELSLAIPPPALAGAVREAAGNVDETEWEQASQRLAAVPAIITGRGRTSQAPMNRSAALGPAVVIPTMPPDWARQPLHAEATSDAAGAPLKTARKAESLALADLRRQVELLAWRDGSIGEAARAEPALAQAIDTALAAARVAGVDYLADGSVRVRVTLSGQHLWNQLSSARISSE